MNLQEHPFSLLGIGPALCRSIDDIGFEQPTKIQTLSIPGILAGRDLAGQAQTGTGKTAAFALPILQRINVAVNEPQALVISPTRELAIQITGEFIKLGSRLDGVQVTPVYGGQPIQRQIKRLEGGAHVVVGTPGRLIDHLKRKTLRLDGLKTIVLDEADEMLNMGFRDDIEKILEFAPQSGDRQTVMFSATFSKSIRSVMKKWFNDPELIRADTEAETASNIEQYLLEVRDSVRTEAISRLLDINSYRLGLVFCNTRRNCDSLQEEMRMRGYSSAVLHGGLTQPARDRVMSDFRKGRTELLIATDVAARGLDVEDVDVVFNYDLPQDPEFYVHRIGRTGRAGRSGVAYTFVSGRKRKSVRYLEKKLGISFRMMPLPTAAEVETARSDVFLAELVEILESGGLRPYIEKVEHAISDRFTPIEAAAALMKMAEVNEERSDSDKGKRDRNRSRPSGETSKEGEKRSRQGKSERPKKSDKSNRPAGKIKEPFYARFQQKDNKSKNRKRR